jgi:tetratricopeptide (TPR) repeat protein
LVLQPRSSGAWLAFAVTLEHAGRFDEASAAYDSVARLSPSATDEVYFRVPIAIRRGDFVEVEVLVGPKQRYATPGRQWEALWWRSTSLRYQGRLREALALTRAMRAIEHEAASSPHGLPYNSNLIAAEVLLEMGRAREAAALFDSLALFYDSYSIDSLPGRYARHLCWMLTLRGTALATAGDTAPLQRLADSLGILGQRSSYGRDRLLHHHIRGLLLLSRGHPAEAATEFRKAVFSLTYGYTRTNLELARTLIAIDRPREAIAVLQPALRGPLDASNLYVTHTELHEMLALAFEAAGQRDSAIAHYRWIVAAWRDADPEFRPRVETARAHLMQLATR